MANESPVELAAALLHELAEALQATGNYLGALQQSGNEGHNHLSEPEVVTRALSQCMRAQQAARDLRRHLNGRKPAKD